MSHVNNPYNFIPFATVNQSRVAATHESIQQHGLSHAQYHHLNGCIKCRITVKTPLFFGNLSQEHSAQVDDEGKLKTIDYRELQPYVRHDKPALPGNGLRGMIANHIEIISASPPRVLDNAPLTYREAATAQQLAYGVLLIEQDDDGEYTMQLQPLGLPPIHAADGRESLIKWQKIFVDSHDKPLTLSQVCGIKLSKKLTQPTSTLAPGGQLLQWQNLVNIDTTIRWRPDEDENIGATVKVSKNLIKKLNTQGRISAHGQQAIIRNLACNNDREQKIAFLTKNVMAPRLSVDAVVMQNYLDCLNSSDQLKLRKKRQRKAGQKPDTRGFNPLTVHGRIVLFDIGNNAPANDDQCHSGAQITKLAESQIWRAKIDATLHDFIAPELRPFNTARTHLSIAESLLGTVADEGKLEDTARLSAFSSRIRVYDAHYEGGQADLEKRYLVPRSDSPKLPCPSMYFQDKNSTVRHRALIKKKSLSPAKHRLNGYKVYLRHDPATVVVEAKTVLTAEHDERTFAPLAMPNSQFNAEIRFNNLNEQELALLLAALEPAPSYYHQLGMGKPHGYGQVKLQVTGIKLVDKKAHYCHFKPPKPRCWRLEQGTGWQSWLSENSLLATTNPLINDSNLNLLTLVGNRHNYPEGTIAYPLDEPVAGKSPMVFAWFVNNDHPRQSNPQMLPQLQSGGFGQLQANRPPPNKNHKKRR